MLVGQVRDSFLGCVVKARSPPWRRFHIYPLVSFRYWGRVSAVNLDRVSTPWLLDNFLRNGWPTGAGPGDITASFDLCYRPGRPFHLPDLWTETEEGAKRDSTTIQLSSIATSRVDYHQTVAEMTHETDHWVDRRLIVEQACQTSAAQKVPHSANIQQTNDGASPCFTSVETSDGAVSHTSRGIKRPDSRLAIKRYIMLGYLDAYKNSRRRPCLMTNFGVVRFSITMMPPTPSLLA